MIKNIACVLLIFLVFGFVEILPAQTGEETASEYIDWFLQGRPFIEATYGLGEPKQELFTGEFLRLGAGELKLGYSAIKPDKDFVSYLEERFLFGSLLKKDLDKFTSETDDTSKVETEMSRFGSGVRQGYGYTMGKFILLPYNQFTFVWTKVKSSPPASLSQDDVDILNRYEGNYRFGQAFEGGVKLNAFKSFSVAGSYEAAVIFPRHLFGKWLGSFTLMSIGLSAATIFSDRVVDSSPFFGPLMFFVLRNGVAYAFYQAMKDDMNWPFDTETPLRVETFKLGASITF
jgi:hypothetical protein